jgi:hypothetical protein
MANSPTDHLVSCIQQVLHPGTTGQQGEAPESANGEWAIHYDPSASNVLTILVTLPKTPTDGGDRSSQTDCLQFYSSQLDQDEVKMLMQWLSTQLGTMMSKSKGNGEKDKDNQE